MWNFFLSNPALISTYAHAESANVPFFFSLFHVHCETLALSLQPHLCLLSFNVHSLMCER